MHFLSCCQWSKNMNFYFLIFFEVLNLYLLNFFPKFLIVSEKYIFSVNIFFRNGINSTQKLSFWANRWPFQKRYLQRKYISLKLWGILGNNLRPLNFRPQRRLKNKKSCFWTIDNTTIMHWKSLKKPYIWEVFKP